MNFPQTVDEFMEQYKIVDREKVYTNGAEMVPIFRMKQWFEHEALGKDTNVPTWIPFTAETMPKEDGEYFVLYDDKYAEDYDTGRVGVADFYVDCEAFGYWQERYDPVSLGFVDSDFIEIKVKKWMPIPKEE